MKRDDGLPRSDGGLPIKGKSQPREEDQPQRNGDRGACLRRQFGQNGHHGFGGQAGRKNLSWSTVGTILVPASSNRTPPTAKERDLG